jgi:hypothetical protein
MDTTQEQHERAVGAAFIEWYNRQNSTEFRYHDRGADPPDLVYHSGSQELLLEITAAYEPIVLIGLIEVVMPFLQAGRERETLP